MSVEHTLGGNGVPPRGPEPSPRTTSSDGDPGAVLERLRTRLLDLTLLNRLLNFKQTSPRVLRIIDELPDQLFERLRAGAELEILPVPAPPKDHPLRARAEGGEKAARAANAAAYAAELGLATSFDLPQPENGTHAAKHSDDAIQTLLFPTDLEKVLRAIASDSRSALEEKGSNILYLSFGFLEWYESASSEKAIVSPLVMLPVTIRRGEPDRKTGAYRFFLAYADEDVLPNLSLQEKLRCDFRVTLPDLEDEDTPETYLARLGTTMLLLPRWTIRRHVSLGLLAFSKLFMYRDLDPKAWPVGAGPVEDPRVAELLGAGDGPAAQGTSQDDAGYQGEYDFEGGGAGPPPPIVPPIVMDADSSQHSAIVDAFVGKSLVIEGPPGTGKSQTIANLIAAAMDSGKSVLFVAEKLTALEVVRRRLDEVGLGPFCLELHSDKTQKSQLMEDLKRRIDLRRTFRPPAALDERARVLADSRKRLNAYARRINARIAPIGWTVHEVLWGTERRRSMLGAQAERWKNVVVPNLESLTLSGYEELRRSAHTFGEALAQVRRAGPLGSHPFWGIWAPRADPAFEAALLATLERLRQAAQEAVTRLATLSTELGAPCPPSVDALQALRIRVEALHEKAHRAILSGAAALATAAARRELSDWTDELAAYLEGTHGLEEALPDAAARRALFELPASAFEAASSSAPTARLAELPDLVETAKGEIRVAAGLVEGFIAATGVDIPRTGVAALIARDVFACAARAPLDALAYRTRPEDDVDALLETAHCRHADLVSEGAELDAQFHLASLPDAAALEAHTAVCASAGFFAFFSSAYRAAKRQLLVLQREPKAITNAERAASFRTLAAYLRKREVFESDATLKGLLGGSFQGLETRFDKLMAARNWQKEALAVHRRHRRAIGAFSLATAPADLVHDLAASPGLATAAADIFATTRTLLALRAVATEPESTSLADLQRSVDESILLLEPLRAVILRLRGSLPPSAGEVRKLYDQNRAHSASRERLEAAAGIRVALHEGFAGVETPLAAARATHAYANALFDLQTPEALRAYLLRKPDPDFRDRLVALLASTAQALVTMYAAEDGFRTTGVVELGHWYGNDDPRPVPTLVLARTTRALTERQALPTWAGYLRARIALFRAGGDFLREAAEQDERVDLATLATAAEFGVHSNHAARAFALDPELAHHDGVSHSSLRDQFRRYDEEVMRLERERMASRIDSRPVPEGVRASLVKSLTELALLEHELRKQRAHIPIRQLVNRAGGALRALKPCFMMSPRSVAQYLQAGVHTFDLVIMDEASQLRPRGRDRSRGQRQAACGRGGLEAAATNELLHERQRYRGRRGRRGQRGHHRQQGEHSRPSANGLPVRAPAPLALSIPAREPHRLLQRPLLRR